MTETNTIRVPVSATQAIGFEQAGLQVECFLIVHPMQPAGTTIGPGLDLTPSPSPVAPPLPSPPAPAPEKPHKQRHVTIYTSDETLYRFEKLRKLRQGTETDATQTALWEFFEREKYRRATRLEIEKHLAQAFPDDTRKMSIYRIKEMRDRGIIVVVPRDGQHVPVRG